MTESRFIQLLWLQIGVTIAYVVAAFFPGYSDELADAYYNEPVTELLDNVIVLWAVLFPLALAALAGLVGLFFFKRWARSVSLYSTLVGCVIMAPMGPSLFSGFERSLLEVSLML